MCLTQVILKLIQQKLKRLRVKPNIIVLLSVIICLDLIICFAVLKILFIRSYLCIYRISHKYLKMIKAQQFEMCFVLFATSCAARLTIHTYL